MQPWKLSNNKFYELLSVKCAISGISINTFYNLNNSKGFK